MQSRKQPATSIIAACGGVTAVATALGKDTSIVRRWRLPRPTGTDGVIPEDVRPALIKLARENGRDLTYADFAPVAA